MPCDFSKIQNKGLHLFLLSLISLLKKRGIFVLITSCSSTCMVSFNNVLDDSSRINLEFLTLSFTQVVKTKRLFYRVLKSFLLGLIIIKQLSFL